MSATDSQNLSPCRPAGDHGLADLHTGVLAPHARWRSQVVSSGRPAPDPHAHERAASPRPASTPRAWSWAALMHRVLALDVLACPRRGGRLRVIATVQDPAVVPTILAHLGLSSVA